MSQAPQMVARLLGTGVRDWRPVGGGCIADGARATLADGRTVFVKSVVDPQPGFFAAEAAGLRWIAEPETVPVPDVLGVDGDGIVLDWIEPGRATPDAASTLGRGIAELHGFGAEEFGGATPGYIGALPMDNTPCPDWPTFYTERRIVPYLRLAADRGALSSGDGRAVELVIEHCADLAGPAEPPARIHGDLWSGNLHWGADGRCWLIDPAAHGGHRETDLAMLALFGAPYLDAIIAGYVETAEDLGRPLAAGWRDRVPLHQLWPLLVHAAMFGGGYGAQAGDAARRAVR